jgi:hypothetical protein
LNILVDVSQVADIKANIARIIPGISSTSYYSLPLSSLSLILFFIFVEASVMAENAGSIVYSIPKSSDQRPRSELLAFVQQVCYFLHLLVLLHSYSYTFLK